MGEESPPEERYEIRVSWSDEDNAFVALIPYAGGHWKTIIEASTMAKEAIKSYIEIAREVGKTLPHPTRRGTY